MLAAAVRLSMLLLLWACWSHGASAQSPSWSLVSFCYVTYNTLPSSPFLYWSFATQGTLNVSSSSTGTMVTDARGTRQGYYAGSATSITSIAGVAAVGSYLNNNNVISIANASAPLVGSSVLAFVTSAPAPFATGLRISPQFPAGLSYIALTGAGELDNPPNDGETSVVTALWQTSAAISGLSANYTGCTLSMPSSIVNSASDVSLYNSNGAASQFCVDISGGPGEGTTNGAAWNVLMSGTVQTKGWVGTTASGRSASVVTSLSGTRSFVYQNGTTVTTNLTLAPGSAALAAGNSSLFYASGFANNIIYAGWPQLDSYGWALQSSADITVQALADTRTTVARLSINATGELIETIVAGPNGTLFLDRTGTFLTANGSSNSSSLSDLSAQCVIDYGSVAQYEFCYYIDNSALPSSNPQRGIVFAYGLFVAAGPQPQQGRQALRVQKITGVRYVQAMQNGGTAVVVTQNLKHIKYIDQDISLSQPTDDLVFTSSPALDQQGLLIETNGNGIFFSGTSGNTDVRLMQGPDGVSELDSDGVSMTTATTETVSGFFYQPVPASGLGVTSQCATYSTMFAANSNPAPAVNVYSFCYNQASAMYNVSVAAALTLYSTPITFLSRTAYAIAGMNGMRYFSSASGISSANNIIGPSSDWIAKQVSALQHNRLASCIASVPCPSSHAMVGLTSSTSLSHPPMLSVSCCTDQFPRVLRPAGGCEQRVAAGGYSGHPLSVRGYRTDSSRSQLQSAGHSPVLERDCLCVH